MTLFSLSTETLESTIPTPEQLLNEMPATKNQIEFVHSSRRTIEAILSGRDSRFLLIVGPCSLHDVDSTYEYAYKLKVLAEECRDRFFIVMRTYFEKPRTTLGWKGILYDPYLDGSHDVAAGLQICRRILLDLAALHLPVAAELLEINTASYLTDLLSWGCIGARTATSQPHRQLAAGLHFPIGFKNTTDGNILNAVNGIVSAASQHVFLGLHPSGQLVRQNVNGNPFCHLVLRGSDTKTNYDSVSIEHALSLCASVGVLKKVIVDCSHGNSGKEHDKQIDAFCAVMHQKSQGNLGLVGAMLESHLYAGSQALSAHLKYGISVTDPCLDWRTTEKLIREFC